MVKTGIALVHNNIFFKMGKNKDRRKGRVHIGIYTLQIGPFPAILRQKATAGVSLTVAFYLVLQKNLSLWSASQF